MHSPAIQAALDNLVETVRTSVTAEFLEFFRGDAKPVKRKTGRKLRSAPKPKAKLSTGKVIVKKAQRGSTKRRAR